jgi:hypothetical protein
MTNNFTLPFVVVFVLTLSAVAQTDATRAIYESAATIPTNFDGIRAYPAPPEGFNAQTASDEELAAYGIPPRPDQAQDSDGYRHWTRTALVMGNPRSRWQGELKPRKGRSSLPTAVEPPQEEQGTTFGASSYSSKNWSGAINTLPLSQWSSSKSFSRVTGYFNVPVPQQAFNGSGSVCDLDTDQAAFWVGFGGLSIKGVISNNNVAQAGVDIYAYCGFGTNTGAYAWVEWFPNNPAQLFSCNPGDDVTVNLLALSPTSVSVAIVDVTLRQSWGGVITPPSGFQLVGNEAEYIVERPGGDSTPTGLYPLANYIWSFWDFSRAETFSKVFYYPGNTTAGTYDSTMYDDSGVNKISVPSIDKGLQNLFVQDVGCAYVGGCAP